MVRILLVDDNPAVRRYLRAILEQQESWQVCGEARTGAEALCQVLEAPPDLIVLDYQMPDLNGVDVAKQIFELFPKIPILMVTLHLSSQLAEAARQAVSYTHLNPGKAWHSHRQCPIRSRLGILSLIGEIRRRNYLARSKRGRVF